jgi:YqjK-like protein
MNQVGEIRAERARLLARAAVERERVFVHLRAWEAPLALVDRSMAAARYVHRHPQWLIAIAIVFAVMRPRRAVAWVRNGLIAWRVFRGFSAWPRGLAAREGPHRLR